MLTFLVLKENGRDQFFGKFALKGINQIGQILRRLHFRALTFRYFRIVLSCVANHTYSILHEVQLDSTMCYIRIRAESMQDIQLRWHVQRQVYLRA